MKRLDIGSAKLSLVFPESQLPVIDPANPTFVLVLGGREIHGRSIPRRPASWPSIAGAPSCRASWSPRVAR